jgi:hypothetical protein
MIRHQGTAGLSGLSDFTAPFDQARVIIISSFHSADQGRAYLTFIVIEPDAIRASE